MRNASKSPVSRDNMAMQKQVAQLTGSDSGVAVQSADSAESTS